MSLFSRWRSRPVLPPVGRRRRPSGPDAAHLTGFAATRTGVEGYVEPATTVTPTTLLLVAQDGEWTRRRVPDAAAARDLARRAGIPVYDVTLTGYPSRMREWTARRRREERALRRPDPAP